MSCSLYFSQSGSSRREMWFQLLSSSSAGTETGTHSDCSPDGGIDTPQLTGGGGGGESEQRVVVKASYSDGNNWQYIHSYSIMGNTERNNKKKVKESREFPPHHVVAGSQFEQHSAVLVDLLQRPVQQRNQISTTTGRLIWNTQLGEQALLRT